MGRVFSTAEIATEGIPGPEQFTAAASYLLEELDKAPTTGALIFGSVSTRTETNRSDIDILVAFAAAGVPRPETMQLYRSLFQTVRTTYNVQVESTVTSHNDLMTGWHTIDSMFLQNLRTIPEKWSAGINPVKFISPSTVDGIGEFQRYAIAKDSKLSKAHNDSPELNPHAMQRALELPSALGRKSLALMLNQRVGDIDPSINNMPKAALAPYLSRVFQESGVVKYVEILRQADSEYSHLVDGIQAGTSKPAEHRSWLHAHYLPVIRAAIGCNYLLSHHVVRTIKDAKD